MIAVEQGDQQASSVNELVRLHRVGCISVGLTTVSASETLSGSKVFPGSAAQFSSRIKKLGWQDLDLILGPAVIGLTYIGMSKFVDDDFEDQRDAIWQVLFPNLPRVLPADTLERQLHDRHFRRWRNAWCDVHTLWTHIDAARDTYVTSNTRDFQRHSESLEALGLKSVMTPEEAVNVASNPRPKPTLYGDP